VKLYTVGYTRKPLRRCMELLREAEVDIVVDVRLRNRGQLAGWAKRDDLAFILERSASNIDIASILRRRASCSTGIAAPEIGSSTPLSTQP